MKSLTRRTVQVMALFLAGMGGIAFAYAAFRITWMGRWTPWTVESGVNSPLFLTLSGVCCFLLAGARTSSRPSDGILKCSAVLLVVVPGLVLAQHVLGINLGVDLVRSDVLSNVASPNPGRVAPNTCVAFIATGLALFLFVRKPYSSTNWPMTMAISVVTAISFAALTGHLLRLESLYRIADLNQMLPATAVALSMLSVELWLLRDLVLVEDSRSFDRHEVQIARRSIAVLTLVALSAGVTGFAVLRETLERSMTENASLTASTNATSLTNTLDVGLWFPKTISTRPSVRETLLKLERNPQDEMLLDFLKKVGDSFLTAGVTGVEFFGASGQLLASSGTMVGSEAISNHRMATRDQAASLLWLKGYILFTENEVRIEGRLIGRVRSEQRLPVVDKLLATIRASNESADALICSLDGADAFCSPSRFYPDPFRIPMFKAPGELNMPANRAVAGETGVAVVADLRGTQVIAAYVPLGPHGLGLVVKSDVSTLFAPLRERVQLLSVLLVVLVVVGTSALLMRVQPLLRQIVHEQRRTRVILDNSNDAFVAIGTDGRVTDWNAAAERTFGWPAALAIGHDLATLIVSPDQREAHAAGFKRFLLNGAGPVINRRIEVMAVHKEGHEVPIELAVAALHDGTGYIANAFARDITERRAAEQRLAQSERRLRNITDNVPALISQFDQDQRLVFTNPHCARVYGSTPEELLGKTVFDVRGADGHRQLQPYIERVLQGEHVAFESTAVLGGEVHCFQQSYVPDVAADGSINGFYSVSFDVTERKKSEQRVLDSEKRLRDITDNLPVLISYIDAEKRLTFVNATFQEWMGLDPARVLGRPVAEAIGPVLFEERREHMDDALAGQHVSFELDSEALGVRRWLQNEYIPDVTAQGEVAGLYALSTDVTKLKTIERQLSALARNDHLTGLANRYEFNQKLPEALARAERSGDAIALLFMDVDRFKSINDQFGHATGDAVLKEFAIRLSKCVRVTDTVVRLAGDEFVIILEHLQADTEARLVAQKILAQIMQPFVAGEHLLQVTTSVGVAIHTQGSVTPADFLARADKALYEAKAAGRNQYCVEQL